MPTFTVVTNASAGSSDESAVERAADVLRTAGEVELVESAGEQALRDTLAQVTGVVAVAGGDGSLHMTVAALDAVHRLGDLRLGLVPLGTGNDFARTMGIPLEDPEAAARVVIEGELRQIDVLRDDAGGIVVNAVHAGVGADAARAAEPFKSRLGRVGYLLGAVRAGVTTSGHRIRVTADGRVVAEGRRKILQVGIANGTFVGGGTPLSPDARPDDGLADVVVSFAVGPLRRVGYAVRLRRGQHPERDDVVTTQARDVSLDGSGLWLNADGELVGPVDRRRWTVEPGALSFLAPASRDAP